MSAYPFSEDGEPGTWMLVPCIDTKQKVAVFKCPDCKEICSLHGHEIDDDGLVFPKVGCPNTHSCGFDRYIELIDWQKINREKK